MIVLSIDPGFDRFGVSILKKDNQKIEYIYSDCIRTSRDDEMEERLEYIGNVLEEIIDKHKPEVMAIEKIFFIKNKKTGIQVAKICGMCSFISSKKNMEYVEYSPTQIKNAVTGNGRSDKNGIVRMLPHFVEIKKEGKIIDDEYDAIAIGVTHILNSRSIN